MPMPSSGIIVVEKPSSSTASRITTNTSNSSNTINRHHPLHNHHHFHHQPQHHPPPQQKPQQQKQQQSTHIKYYDYYDANENQQLSSQQQQQKHPTIVVDGSVFQNQAQSQPQQQSIQLGGGRKLHTTTLSTTKPSSAPAPASSSSLTLSSLLTSTTKPNLHIQSIKAGPMPQMTKQLPQQQQQQIIQHTSHTTATATSCSNSQQQLNHQPSQQQHVHQVHLATTSTAQHQHPHHQHQQPPTQHQAHMIQVSEEYLEQAQVQAQNHTTASNMMISATGEVIQQQQIFKIVSTDAATGNMIIDTSGANQASNASTTSKVLLSNLTVLSKQQAGATAATISASQQQQSSATAQTINFVNAKQLYTAASSAANPAGNPGVVAANLGKQQKFTVSSANLGGSFKTAALKQTTNTTQYVHQTAGSQQKISMTSGNRNMQMLTATTRMQSGGSSVNHAGVISSSPATAQTMVLQQPHKFVTTNNTVTKSSLGPGGNVMKKAPGTLRMSNNNTTATKLMNNLHAQSAQGVKTFITQTTVSAQQQLQNNSNQLSPMQQQHHTKAGGKSKFVKQYNNAILNSAGAVAIATLPHQQHHQNNINSSGQQQAMQAQSAYMNHHKATAGQTKINKINSKYATANVAAQLPPGTQLHQKTLGQAAQQQSPQSYQGTNNSNIKFVNAQGTIIQQQHQPITPQKIHIKQQQPQYQSLQSFDTVDGNTLYNPQQQQQQQQQHQITNSTVVGVHSSAAGPNGNSSLLTDDIMMVNGTQMTDEISARILQSMSQKSFINQRYQQLQHQQQQPVFQKSPTNNSNMLPPPQTAANAAVSAASQQSASSHTQNAPNNHSNILLSPREYTLYPPVGSSQPQQQPPSPQQPPQAQSQSSSSPNHFCNTSSASGGSLTTSSASNYLSNSMAIITPHSASAGGGGSLGVGSIGGSTPSSRVAQSAPNSRSQSMERKLHESSMSRKSTEYYKVNIKDYHQKYAFVDPTTAAIYATNSSPTAATSLIDFIIPLPSCTTITTTNTLITSAAVSTIVNTTNTNNTLNCAATTITSSKNHNNHNSNHNSLRGSHSNLVTAQSGAAAHTGGATNIAALPPTTSAPPPMSSSLPASSTLMGSSIQGTILPPRSPSIPPSAMIEPQAQVIHLQATKTLSGANNSSNDDDDIIGEEVRPVPVETNDIRLQILHAVLLDHTYANPMPLELPTTFAVQLPSPSQSNVINASPGQHMAVNAVVAPGGVTAVQTQHQQWSLGGIGAVTAAAGPVANNGITAANVATSNYPMYSSQLSRLQQDDDAYSAISGSSRLVVGEIDPGEETETAPEAEAEDDSITRCICDLTHDDGYMICCDKCCAWQHVDCMGIDRQNIPDEYLCELCQPRPVDKSRARSLQVQKRNEQTQLIAQAQAAVAAGTMGAAGSASGSGGANQVNLLPSDVLTVQQRFTAGVPGFSLSSNNPSDPIGMQFMASSGTNMKKGAKMLKKVKEATTGKKSKKAEKLSTAGGGLAGKGARKETKKNTKRKKSAHDGVSTIAMTAAEKYAANLRQWIESYELAVTNHYSPELRARLHSISKPSKPLHTILNTENPMLKEFSMGNLENRATTVPHAGGKILISNLDITPNSPICELRGKYMLTTQYKTQNTSVNMNSPPPNNYHLASYKAHKTPGPFIFFYQMKGSERTVNQGTDQTTTTTTQNPDGTYTTTTTTLPTQLSPPSQLKGPEISVDTRTYGNEARFVRRSCRPNAEIQHLFEKGTIHLFIVALTDIRASTEITIRHEPHDLLAVENKKSNTMVIQPTSTPCACGLSKDCIFGPPLPQLPPAAKSNAGRKSLALNGGTSGTGNVTAKQRKANQQNLNRNRSTSSSGDSNMGGSSVMVPIPTVALSLNSPNLVSAKMGKNPGSNASAALLPLTASCNSNLSNASSTSSTLTSIMHDSGICTSSSSPSVSIPSPTQHMHSPIQQAPNHQQHQQHQQSQQQQQNLRPMQILPQQQQQQQLMASLPTPLILSTDMQQQPPLHPQQKPLQQHQQQQLQQQVLLQSPQPQLQPLPQQQLQLQPLTVVSQAATLSNHEIEKHPHTPEQTQGNLFITTPQQQLQLISPQQLPQPIPMQSCLVEEAPSQEETVDASALQSFDCTPLPNNLTSDKDAVQQPQIVVIPSTDLKMEDQEQPTPQTIPQPAPTTTPTEVQTFQPQQLITSVIAMTEPMAATTSSVSSVCSSSNTSPHQQKSPQKNNQSHQNNIHPGRKTPAKQARTTSFSEDNEQHNDESVVSATPNSSSTPKEKPKLSREDRKMEAILKAIEKMERNQQRKQEQKQTKRQNSGSHNTTPTSPNKTFDSADSSGAKRSNSQSAGCPTRTKKKRKAANRGTAQNNQRKRRQSRMNSQESIEGCDPHANDTVTSESDGCAAIHSPPIQTLATLKHSPVATTEPAPSACETIPNNVDQAAGLLMAFANPNVNPTQSAAVEPQSPQRPQPPPQYMISPHEITTSPPSTPPSQVSSACLLIEAAVGPLESNLEPNLEPISADVINAEFKYPLQAKTKKLLMNNWLHQAEETSAGGSLEQTSPSQTACATGGLDSLVQAALNDFKQTQSEETTTQPQNLSIVAQRVEEFIQQTEGGPPTPPPTKHSYEYEQQQMYAMAMSSPAVDLSLKHQTLVHTAKPGSDNKNFHLPLQVSTCSNNSSVKKRWLRQAISEETHEESQSNYSMSPSPTTPVAAAATSNFLNPQLQTGAVPMGSPSPALTANNIPNGFTTPLKKRRLLLTDKDDEENVAQNSGDSMLSTPLSPPPAKSAVIQKDPSVQDEYDEDKPEISQLTMAAPHDIQEDVDVDVEKCEQHETSQDQPTATDEMEQEQDVDIISPPLDEEMKSDIVTKHRPGDVIKEEDDHQCLVPPTQSALETPAEFNDQEDDVDILRSPSPGREMIKAEDNLVKIEPEDTSGTDDVKIDVEREESMAADDIMSSQLKQEYKEETETCADALKVEQVEIKHEHKMETIVDDVRDNIMDNDLQSVCKAEYDTKAKVQISGVKEEERQDEMAEPKPKRLKLEDTVAEHMTVIVKGDTRQQNENIKQENVDVVTTNQEVILIPKEAIKTEKSRNESEEVSSISSSTVRTVAKVAADSTFSTIDSATPPHPPSSISIQSCATSASVAGTPLQRNKILSDDDIQARLHNFHKENILFLQSRNKKSKSSNSTSSSLNSLVEHHRNNNKGNSLSLSANHHHHHDSKDKSDKLSSKHHKNSTSSSLSSGSSKKQKLHKRERTASSSTSSNSHKNSTTHVSSTSTFAKNTLINSSTNSLSSTSSSSSSSSKKIKSLKKSSSSSSTSSTNSTSSFAQQNSNTSSSDNKDKHQRQRTISNSSNTATNATTSSPAPQTPFGTSKKRQLNFELELTKDMHLVNSVVTSCSKHKRLEESPVSAKKSRKESSSTTKDEQKNGTNKAHKSSSAPTDKPQEKEKKSSAVSVAITSPAPAKLSPISTSGPQPVKVNVTTAVNSEEVKNATVLTMSSSTPATTILREHPTLPHFNNIVLTPGMNSLSTPPPQTVITTPTLQPLPPQPPPPSQNISNHGNNPSCVAQIHANSQLPSILPDTTPPSISSPLSTTAVNSSNHLPFFNTIYGKLLDNHTPSLTSPVTAPPPVQSIAAVTVPPSMATTGVLSEYLDTKLKSYNSLGGYVSHTALFGLNNTSTKDILAVEKESSNEMPAPSAPPSALAVSVTASSLSLTLNASTSSSPNVSAMKIHTKTASHDPRLNPHLTAPEPPPQPKRKLSINEYRKRMQQSSSNDSASNSLASTPTTPPTPMETASVVASGIPVVINKCTLNSEHLTLSVDSQIQKEIIASSSLNVYDSLNSSNSSSTSNSSLLNDTLLKSSSMVEEDSTKGQFNAAPTLLEKQQESLCARLKSLKEKQGLTLGGGGTRSRFSSFSESVGSIAEYSLRKDEDDFDLLGKRHHSISSSIGGGDLLDNCLEEISSTSTSMSSSREPSPERYTTTSSHHGKHVLTASATTTCSTSGGQTKQHHNNGDKTTQPSNVERKKSVDTA